MIIAHITDTHICLPEPENSSRPGDLEQAIDEINAMQPAPDIVVHTGDIVHTGKLEEYEVAKSLLDRLPMPLFVIPGNKDIRQPMENKFSHAIGENSLSGFIQYSVENWPFRLLFLDTLVESERLGKLCQKRLTHLEEMLEQNPQKPTVIFMHHTPFDVVQAPEPCQFDDPGEIEKLSTIVNRHRQVKQIICGHSHRQIHAKLGTIPAHSIPAIALDLRKGEYEGVHKNKPIVAQYTY